jgi:hypothetical protein
MKAPKPKTPQRIQTPRKNRRLNRIARYPPDAAYSRPMRWGRRSWQIHTADCRPSRPIPMGNLGQRVGAVRRRLRTRVMPWHFLLRHLPASTRAEKGRRYQARLVR